MSGKAFSNAPEVSTGRISAVDVNRDLTFLFCALNDLFPLLLPRGFCFRRVCADNEHSE